MKVFNKILCFLAVLAFCVPLLVVPVSASDDELSLEDYYLTAGTGDFSGVDIRKYDEDVSNVEYPEVAGVLGSGDKRRFVYYDLTDSISRFKMATSSMLYQVKESNNSRDFYYFYRYGIDKTNHDVVRIIIDVYFSFKPLKFVLNSSNDYVISTTENGELNYLNVSFATFGYTHTHLYKDSTFVDDVYGLFTYMLRDVDDEFKPSNTLTYPAGTTDFNNSVGYFSGNKLWHDITWDEIYTNCDLKVGDINLKNESIKDLKDQVDFKLTPNFGIDMDRVFDQNTGQDDYFKLEVTNNSDKPIQFSASIVPYGTPLTNTVSISDLADDRDTPYFLNEYALWNYITDTEYYVLDYKSKSKYLGLSVDYEFYAEKRKGNFYWILVSPGQTYTDFVYWENVKILTGVKYDFVASAIPLDSKFDAPSAVFMTMNEVLSLEKNDSKNHWWSIFGDVDYDDSLSQYKVELSNMSEIYRQDFSVVTIPNFSNEIKGGNSKTSGGWSDTINQANNPYYKQNLKTGEIKSVSNWSEYSGGLGDVDVNLDNVSIGDVKNYVTYSQDFFGLLKSVFQTFSGLWMLIVFGLTAMIVIGIIRYIRG